MRKNWLQERLFPCNFFHVVLLIRNHTVFLVQFETNLHLRVFQKVEIAISAF